MRQAWAELFPLDPGLVMFNHASYGLAAGSLLARSEAVRRELETGPNVTLGEALQERLAQVLAHVCAEFGLDAGRSALTASATAGAAALQRSLPLGPGDVVVALDCEYSSVLRGWERRCAETGADLVVLDVPLPLTDVGGLFDRMSAAVGDRVAILQFSAITSSAALQLPVARLAAWGHDRGAVVIVDAAHVLGHADARSWTGVDAAFGTVHKWIPVPRSVGILWVAPELVHLVRPAEVSLTWDSEDFGRRFAWPGTFDPAARLCLPEALALHAEWARTGELKRCEALADRATEDLAGAGAVPTAGHEDLRPPRMRAFVLDGVPAPVLRQSLLDAGIRAWSGELGPDSSLLRIATHVYNDQKDIDMVRHVVTALTRQL